MRALLLPMILLGACCAHHVAQPAPAPASTHGGDHVKTGVTIPLDYLLALPVKVPLERLDTHPGPPPDPPSPDFAASYALFEDGHRAYAAKDYLRAADTFVRAAQALRVRTGIHAFTADANRSDLYEDAAYAWRMAGAADTGRATLKRLQRDDAATANDVRKALEVLEAP
jgi:hypothetical protein